MPFHLYKHISKKQEITVVDKLMSVTAVVNPLTALPQVVKIYSSHTVTGVSLWTWIGFMTMGLVFLAYGIVHKIKPFIVSQILWFIVDSLVVAGFLIYK